MLLGELADIQTGYPFRSRLEPDPEGNLAVIQMRDIDEANLLRADGATRVQLDEAKVHHLLRVGDVLFRSRGQRNGAAHVRSDIGPAVLAAPLLLVRPHSILPDYLCWYINAPATQAQLAALSSGTSVQMITAEALRSLEVPVPPMPAQQRIVQAAVLAEQEQSLQARITNLRQRLTTHILMNYARETTP